VNRAMIMIMPQDYLLHESTFNEFDITTDGDLIDKASGQHWLYARRKGTFHIFILDPAFA
jgi:hypothetical protein